MRERRKPTARELGGGINIHTEQINRIMEVVQALMSEINMLSMILIEDLKARGLCDEIVCAKCGHLNNVPNFGIFGEADKNCVQCGDLLSIGDEEE